jgi:hypothetical protein
LQQRFSCKGGTIREISDLETLQLTSAPVPPGAPRQLLAHVVVTEDAELDDAYTAMILFAMQLDGTS